MYPFFAFRNLVRRSRRYIFIFSAMALSFAVITITSGISLGAMLALQDKAARYFAGHISITGFMPGSVQEIEDPQGIVDLLHSGSFPLRTIAPRTIYYAGNVQLFFEGERVIQRRLIGVDYEREGAEFSTLDMVAGAFSVRNETDGPGIVISQAAAKLLRCKVGDAVTLFIHTDKGTPNSASLVVRGIFNETSLFGYAAYMDRRYLNRLMQKADDFCTDIALYVAPGTDAEPLSRRISDYLSTFKNIAPAFDSREARDALLPELVQKGALLVVMTQGAQLSQITQFITAFMGITYFILIVFLLITMTGVVNTYRVLIHERRKEIGVLRALGTQKSGVIALFLWEAFELSLFASFAGLVLGAVSLFVLSRINLSAIPGSGLVLEKGHVRFTLSVSSIILNQCLLVGTTIIAVWRPSREGSHVPPVLAMRGGA